MKLANLFYYFFGTSTVAQNTGSASLGVTQAIGHGTVPVRAEDSRGWFRYRFDLRAKVFTPSDSRLEIGLSSASASSSAPISGIEVVAELVPARGYADVSISVSVPLSGVDAGLEIGTVQVIAESSVVVTGIQSDAVVSTIAPYSSASIVVRGMTIATIFTNVSVVIGPDQELEELLFLLEVA